MIWGGVSVFAFIFGLIFLYILCRIFIKPIRWLLKLLLSGVFGGLMLAAVNLVGGFAGMYVAVTPIASLIAGLLGIPGIALVIALQYLL